MSAELSKILSSPYVFALRRPQQAIQFLYGESAPLEHVSNKNFQLYVPGYEREGAGLNSQGAFWVLPHRSSFESLPPPQKKKLNKKDREEAPALDGWIAYCEKIKHQLDLSDLQKVVPVRSVSYSLSKDELDPLELVNKIFEESDERSYSYFLKWPQGVFLGKTPELLFKRSGDMIKIPVIAGTREHHGADANSQAESLLSDTKERLEHQIVVDGIKESLKEMGLEGKVSFGPEPLFLKTLVHLQSEIVVEADKINSMELVNQLHPTPAVGGIPRLAAWNFIGSHEGQKRGLFSSPILVKDGEEELCLVALRSALIVKESIRFYAGAGYVKGSDPEREWRETEAKMKVMEDLIYGK